MIMLNGQRSELCAGETIYAALLGVGLARDAPGIAVAVNGEVVPRSTWGTFKLPEGARVEILTAMQGG